MGTIMILRQVHVIGAPILYGEYGNIVVKESIG